MSFVTVDGVPAALLAIADSIKASSRDSVAALHAMGLKVVMLTGDLRGIAQSILLSRATMRNIRQNLVFAFLYNTLGIPIAAGVLYPFSASCSVR